MKIFEIEATRYLPDHDRVLQAAFSYFNAIPGAIGCFLSGSIATNKMDQDSDLDVGFVFQREEDRERVWQRRWEWKIAPWFHRFDADHIKPYFVIYLYEPQIKADINLYIESDLPSVDGGPYSIIWDKTGALENWLVKQSKQSQNDQIWEAVIHEDERFWAWSFYVYQHVHRGEYYHIASDFSALRDIVEKWAARLAGYSRFGTRKLEDQEYAKRLLAYDLFPKPNRESLKVSMKDTIEIQLLMRKEIGDKLGISWKTTDSAIIKITQLIESL